MNETAANAAVEIALPDAAVARPQRRLWQTWLRLPRNLQPFTPRIALSDVLPGMPEPAEAAHWGEVLLLEDLAAVLHRDGTASFRTHIISAPWGDQNLAEWDELTRVFNPRKWKPTVRRAVVHLPDGTVRQAKRVSGPAGPVDRGLTLTFAPLRPGVVVEFEEQQDHFVPNDLGPVLWAEYPLQWLFPCRRRRLTIAVAEPFAAAVALHYGAPPPREWHWRDYLVRQWDLTDVPGIEVDNWTPAPREFVPCFDASTLADWSAVARHYRKDLLPNGDPPPEVRRLARQLAEGAETARDKVRNVYRYATCDVRYGRHPSETQLHAIRDPHKMLEDLRGDCKDKSALMVMLLAEMGVAARVAVLLTAQNGRMKLLPSLRFDHAIVVAEVDGTELWCDPAAGNFTFGELPLNDQGVWALVLDAASARLVETPRDPPERQRVERVRRGRITEEGDYTFTCETVSTAERAALARAVLRDRHEEHRRRIVQQAVAEDWFGAEVEDVSFEGLDDLDRPVVMRYQVAFRRWARPIEDLLLIRIPWAETTLIDTTPLGVFQRPLPLQAPPVLRLDERQEIELPAGFTGYGLPFEAKADCPWASYRCRIAIEAGKLVCTRRMDSFGGVVPPEGFPEFKRFWETCARADLADVVLIRRRA